MRLTTLCYLIRDGRYLMLYRNKKENDQSEGKYLGVGGKMIEGESPDECARREILEETGFTVEDLTLRGVVTFLSDCYEDEIMFLYSAEQFTGDLRECDEGELSWVDADKVLSLPAWEGDKYFLKPLLEGREGIEVKLSYRGDRLIEASVGGEMVLAVFE